MNITTKATAPSPGQPPQSSLSGGQGGAKNLPDGPSDTPATTDYPPGPSSGHNRRPSGSGEPQSLIPQRVKNPQHMLRKRANIRATMLPDLEILTTTTIT